MMFSDCAAQPLAEFVDGELSGTERRTVSQHLDVCPRCASEVVAIRNTSDMVRTTLEDAPVPEFSGLASGVIGRLRAERLASWHGLYDAAVDGWRQWLLVGSGSLAAGVATTVFVLALLQLGPAAGRDDSLAAILNDAYWQVSESPGGQLLLTSSRASSGLDPSYVVPDPSELLLVPHAEGVLTEYELVGALSDALSREGKAIDMRTLPNSERLYAEGLLENITWLRGPDPDRYRIRIFTNTTVSAKGL